MQTDSSERSMPSSNIIRIRMHMTQCFCCLPNCNSMPTCDCINNRGTTRGCIAVTILILGIAGISAVAITVVAVDRTYAQSVFNILVPVIASWIGTVLAFYFGRENFESANQATQNLVNRLTPQRIANGPASAIMTDIDRVKKYIIQGAGLDADDVKLKEIQDIYRTENVTRLPIMQGTLVQYMIHQSMVEQYLANNHDVDPVAKMLREFINERANENPPVLFDHGHGFLTVGPSATVNQARELLEANPRVQDIFITSTGGPTAPVKGWISNGRLARETGTDSTGV